MRQPILVCPKLLLGTWFLSLAPKADPILDGKAMNLSLISVCLLPEARPGNDIAIGLVNRPQLAPFPCRQFPPFHGPKP
jgi:hypothetical protein